jgi:putative thioredoxin
MQTNFQDFEQDILKASFELPIVVDFWAEWCGPCRMLGPVLDKLVRNAENKWRLLKVNIDENPAVAQSLQIQSIPAVKMFYEGRVIAEFMGAIPERQIVEWLEENLPTESKKLNEAAKRALSSGNVELARRLLQEAINENAENYEARGLLATLVFERNPQAASELVAPIPIEDPVYSQAESILTLSRLINVRDEFVKNINGDPKAARIWQLYLDGIDALSQQNYEAALEAWIDVMTYDRQLDDDGARKACVAVFKLLGTDHDITQKYHRRFSMALY